MHVIIGHQRRRLLLGIVLGSTALIATLWPAAAATMGFTRQFDFPPNPGPNVHWISLPWRYTPQDVGTPGVVDAEDVCQDLGGTPAVAAVVRWNEASSTLIEHTCGTGSPFPILKGVGYAVRNGAGRTIDGAVAGAHDDSFAYSIPPTSGSELTWLSVPYHLRIPSRPGSLQITAEDLCQQIGAAEIVAVVRWNETAAAYEAYGCGSTLQLPFEIERGKSYGVVNRPGQTIAWQPIHF